ncbi:hypothetical protein HK102_004861 [Quaeritorhiza haematococci]|nr:hypothetical protein HK102_004861 [Quaeritorhiza haematococci]
MDRAIELEAYQALDKFKPMYNPNVAMAPIHENKKSRWGVTTETQGGGSYYSGSGNSSTTSGTSSSTPVSKVLRYAYEMDVTVGVPFFHQTPEVLLSLFQKTVSAEAFHDEGYKVLAGVAELCVQGEVFMKGLFEPLRGAQTDVVVGNLDAWEHWASEDEEEDRDVPIGLEDGTNTRRKRKKSGGRTSNPLFQSISKSLAFFRPWRIVISPRNGMEIRRTLAVLSNPFTREIEICLNPETFVGDISGQHLAPLVSYTSIEFFGFSRAVGCEGEATVTDDFLDPVCACAKTLKHLCLANVLTLDINEFSTKKFCSVLAQLKGMATLEILSVILVAECQDQLAEVVINLPLLRTWSIPVSLQPDFWDTLTDLFRSDNQKPTITNSQSNNLTSDTDSDKSVICTMPASATPSFLDLEDLSAFMPDELDCISWMIHGIILLMPNLRRLTLWFDSEFPWKDAVPDAWARLFKRLVTRTKVNEITLHPLGPYETLPADILIPLREKVQEVLEAHNVECPRMLV